MSNQLLTIDSVEFVGFSSILCSYEITERGAM
jgi:hypothetical protein